MQHAPLKLDPNRLFVFAGPCVIESQDTCLQIASHLKQVCDRLKIQYIFKASFDKANRSSGSSFRGPGMEDGVAVLKTIKERIGVPVLTDIHEASQAAEVATVVDVLQVPAFLARQTDLLIACGRTGRSVNVKKGQFMSPQEMGNAVEKVRSTGNNAIMLCERGTFFGYNRLVNDFPGLAEMQMFGCPVVFDITHSTQQPAGQKTQSGGNPQYSPLLARAAIATGCVDGLFLECHPEPTKAKSDSATILPLNSIENLLTQCAELFALRTKW